MRAFYIARLANHLTIKPEHAIGGSLMAAVLRLRSFVQQIVRWQAMLLQVHAGEYALHRAC